MTGASLLANNQLATCSLLHRTTSLRGGAMLGGANGVDGVTGVGGVTLTIDPWRDDDAEVEMDEIDGRPKNRMQKRKWIV